VPSALPPEPARSRGRQIASTLDTALLVFFALVVLAVGWWVLKAVLGTVVFFGKLAVLAVVVTLAIRAWVLVRGRFRRGPRSGPR